MQEQEVMYSEYKKCHGFKYQAVVCSDGLIGLIADFYEGKTNDYVIV